MANNKSALKRIKINERNRLRNKLYKTLMKRSIKECLIATDNYNESPNSENFTSVQSSVSKAYQKIDKCVKLNILHINTAARKKSKLGLVLKNLS